MSKEESFYVYDLSDVEHSMSLWQQEMHGITPWYAVKTNPDPMLVKKLASLGANFDCASPREIDIVLGLGVSPDRIIYANPCKRITDIEYAVRRGVTLTTFDSVCELKKLKRAAPQMRLVLRLYANDPTAQCVLSNKFGAKEDDWQTLIESATLLDMTVVGVSFHVGSGASNPNAFAHAIASARRLCDLAEHSGHTMQIVDIGGGFSHSTVFRLASVIQDALHEHFHDFMGEVIAEPGRFFAETCAVLYTRVIGVRDTPTEVHATITDGVYGSFNNIVYDHAEVPTPQIYRASPCTTPQPTLTTLFGPTCDGFDKVVTTIIPRLNLGDFVYFQNMGAYTIAGACNFNGIQFMSPTCYYV